MRKVLKGKDGASALAVLRTRSIDGLGLLIEVIERFVGNECPQLAAALAYYTIFSLPALVLITITGLGVFVSAEQAQQTLIGTSSLFAQSMGGHVVVLIRQANHLVASGPWWSLIASVLALAFGATRGFVQLQIALNRAWAIRPGEDQSAFKKLFFKRLISFAMLLAIGPLVFVIAGVSTVLSYFERELASVIPPFVSRVIDVGFATLLSFAMMTAVLTAMYRYLPDAKIKWRQALPGGVFGALGFEVIKSLMTAYLNRAGLSDVYGQASTLAVLLVWIYVAANLTFLGAQFAYVWSEQQGSPLEPEEGASHDEHAVKIEWAPRVKGWLSSF
jgi:membrane protein